MLLGFAATILLGQAVAAVCAMVAAGCANTATMRLRHTDAAGCAMVAAVCARFAGRGRFARTCAHRGARAHPVGFGQRVGNGRIAGGPAPAADPPVWTDQPFDGRIAGGD